MAGKVLEIKDLTNPHNLATEISNRFTSWYTQLSSWKEEKKELRNYVFATDTSKTTNSTLPWKNSTTLPKLAQIRDNLHANYMSALFSRDDWFDWEGASQDDDTQEKRAAIKSYMRAKLKDGGFRETVSRLIYDYIDNGNVIADVEFVKEYKEDPLTGDKIPGYIGPRLVRRSPFDVVFNPTAVSFAASPKIVRYVKTIGELLTEAQTNPELKYNLDIINEWMDTRRLLQGYSSSDIDKAEGYSIDGFGSLLEFYQSDFIEILEFEGDIHDEAGNLLTDQIITVVDRARVIRQEVSPSWFAGSSMFHTGWRLRPDNLYAMGPLDNLVGMQYRIDHLENAKADAYDLAIQPPLGIRGNVEEFSWGPNEQVYLGEDGEVIELGKNVPAIMAADTEIAILEQRMEEMAGAPKSQMGIRTPGEKTAFEVQSLDNAGSRIFQDKINNFESEIIEKALNGMLEIAKRHMEGEDLVRTMDDDFGVASFIKIQKEDITAKGKLRPRGASHHAAKNQLFQSVIGIFSSPVGQIIAPHVSSVQLAKMTEDMLGLERFELIRENIGIAEQAESQALINRMGEDLQVEQETPVEGEEDAEQ